MNYGKGLDKRLSDKLIEQVARDKPELSPSMVQKKALGNWGWLLPHALTQLLIDRIMELIDRAKTEANRTKKKGRKIRIKKWTRDCLSFRCETGESLHKSMV